MPKQKFNTTVIAVSFIIALSFITFSNAQGAAPGGANEKSASASPLSTRQIEMLIAPYRFGGKFSDGWDIGYVVKSDVANSIFTIINERKTRVFIWITAKNDKIWHQAQSKNFNMIAVGEDSDHLTKEQLETAQAVFALIKKNDRGDHQLRIETPSPKDGIKVSLPVMHTKVPNGVSHVYPSPLSIVYFLTLLIIIVTIFLSRAAKKRGKVKTN